MYVHVLYVSMLIQVVYVRIAEAWKLIFAIAERRPSKNKSRSG